MLIAVIIFMALLFSTSEFGIVVSGFHCINGGLLHREYSTPFGCTGRALRVKCTTENGAGAVGERESAKEVGEEHQEIDKAVGDKKRGRVDIELNRMEQGASIGPLGTPAVVNDTVM